MDISKQVLSELKQNGKILKDRVLPDYGNFSIVGIAPTVAKFLGFSFAGNRALPIGAYADFDGCEQVVVLLIDSLNEQMLDFLLANSPELRDATDLRCILTSTFPSVTPTCIASILSGKTPAEHGIAGFRFFAGGRVINFFKLSPVENEKKENVLLDEGFDLRVFRIDDIFHACERKGIGYGMVLPLKVARSRTTRILSGQKVMGYSKVERLFDSVKNDAGLTYVYASEIDEIVHKSGIRAESAYTALSKIATAIERWLVKQKSTILIVASDHGQIDVDRVIDLRDEKMMKMMRHPPAVSGGRVVYFYTDRSGKLIELLKKKCGNCAEILRSEDALWLYGSGNGRNIKERIGEVVAIARGRTYFYFPYSEGGTVDKASHSALSREEMLVPFLVARK
jgi:predicted AlkP superfamily pyrophosphatase or phosphodiesterase